MELNPFQRELSSALGDIELRFDERMSRHTSFRIGGPVEVMAFPKSVKELVQLLEVSRKLDITPAILGAGTNVLAPDQGMKGLVICLKDCLTGMEQLDDTHIRVMAGVTMARAAVYAAGLGLSGLEFAHGIPGTVGGGVYMNAGAYGGDISQVLVSADILSMDGRLSTYSAEQMHLSYRHSILEEEGGIVICAEFALQPDSPDNIRARMKELIAKRTASQPLDLPSAGSAFKRPVGGYAAALIDQAGLKGYRVGGAAISEKHAGFAVNMGNATSQDVVTLLEQVSARVYEDSGIRLEPEVRIW